MDIYDIQKNLVKLITNKKLYNALRTGKIEKNDTTNFLNSFDKENLDLFINMHNAKRSLRFDYVFPKLKKKMGNNWRNILDYYFLNYEYLGQNPNEECRSLLNYLSESSIPSDLVDLAKHEYSVYEISLNYLKYKLIKYDTNLFNHNSIDGQYRYMYLKNPENNKINIFILSNENLFNHLKDFHLIVPNSKECNEIFEILSNENLELVSILKKIQEV